MVFNRFGLKFFLILLVAGQFAQVEAEILYVPIQYELISSAIESSEAGDTILVNPGTYNEDISIPHDITLASLYLARPDSSYIASTIIRGTGENSVISIRGEISPLIIGFTITGGDALYGGGISVSNYASPRIKRCIITECGSGIAVINHSSPLIENCRIVNNSRGNGGVGIYCRDSSNPRIRNTLIANNNGSGLYITDNSDARVYNCLITENRAKGLLILESNPTLINCIINNNTDNTVGGVYLGSESSPEFTNCTISGNTGDIFGGIVIYHSSPSFDDCRIVDNTGGSVGGIKCSADSSPYFTNTLIRGNVGLRRWGGIYCDDSQPTFRDCEISDNISGEGCAGISLNESVSLFVKCLIYDHHSPNEGGAFYITDSNPTILNCTIVRNSSDEGGALYFEGDGGIQIRNSIIWDNTLPNFYIDHGGDQNQWETSLFVSYSDIEEDLESVTTHGEVFISWKKGNFDADPMFVNPQNEDYHLTEHSPCIDSGNPYGTRDRDGTVSDLGAFYFSQATIRLSSNTFNFQNIHSGEIDSLPLVISNLGEQYLIIQNLQLRPSLSPFSISAPPLPDSIGSDDLRRYWIVFAPEDYGEFHAVLTIVSNVRLQNRLMVFISGDALSSPEANPNLPTVFSVGEIYPNPFNSQAVLEFFTPRPQIVSIELIDLNGRLLQTVQNKLFNAGAHEVVLHLESTEAGAYFIRIKSLNFERIQKIVFLH